MQIKLDSPRDIIPLPHLYTQQNKETSLAYVTVHTHFDSDSKYQPFNDERMDRRSSIT